MKIVVFGLCVSSAWGNGHATQWRALLRALAALGHEATFFERDTPFYAAHRDLPEGPGYRIVTYPTWDAVRAHAAREIATSDVAIVTSYQADADAACEAVLAGRALRVFYDLDAPITVELLDRGDRAPWLPVQGLADFDLVLSFTGGDTLSALAARLGARRVAPLYGCVDAEVHRCRADDAPYAWDLSYLGTYSADRQPAVDRLLFEVAKRMQGRPFALGGPMYPGSLRLPTNLEHRPHVPPDEHPSFYGSSRATLNVTRAPMRRVGYCPSARLFEAAACGTPIVSDAWAGLDQFFEPGREIIVVHHTDDVVRALSSDLRPLARRARERVIHEHTARRRALDLLALLRQPGAVTSRPGRPCSRPRSPPR